MVRDVKYGVTAEFWLRLYLNLIEKQHLMHTTVQENILLEFFLPLYLSLQKINYARYGSFYVDILLKIEELYQGLKMIWEKGTSAQAQEKVPLRVAIDQRGEQTLNRHAKTTGGITNFASDVKLFASMNRKVNIQNRSQVKTIETNRNVLGSLLSLSAKTGKVIDFEEALKHPLSSVPLSLANPDGSCRSIAKSKLQNIILS